MQDIVPYILRVHSPWQSYIYIIGVRYLKLIRLTFKMKQFGTVLNNSSLIRILKENLLSGGVLIDREIIEFTLTGQTFNEINISNQIDLHCTYNLVL